MASLTRYPPRPINECCSSPTAAARYGEGNAFQVHMRRHKCSAQKRHQTASTATRFYGTGTAMFTPRGVMRVLMFVTAASRRFHLRLFVARVEKVLQTNSEVPSSCGAALRSNERARYIPRDTWGRPQELFHRLGFCHPSVFKASVLPEVFCSVRSHLSNPVRIAQSFQVTAYRLVSAANVVPFIRCLRAARSYPRHSAAQRIWWCRPRFGGRHPNGSPVHPECVPLFSLRFTCGLFINLLSQFVLAVF